MQILSTKLVGHLLVADLQRERVDGYLLRLFPRGSAGLLFLATVKNFIPYTSVFFLLNKFDALLLKLRWCL